jgi:predicted anti-sigma-YlaC factor YlaD
MECTEYQRLISRLQDGELPSGETAGVFLHLSMCGTCREFYQELQVLDGALNRIADRLPSESAVRAIERPVAVRTHNWWNQRVALRVPVLGLLLCAMAVSLFLLIPGSSPFNKAEQIYVTKLPTVVVDATTAPPEPRQQ